MLIKATLTKTYTYHFNGVDDYLHEIKDMIVKHVKSVKVPVADWNISASGDQWVIDIVCSKEIPFMTLHDITDLIPRWYSEFSNKAKAETQQDRDFYFRWIEEVELPEETYATRPMNLFVRRIRRVYRDAKAHAANGDWSLAAMTAGDFEDLCNVLEHLKNGDYENAYADYRCPDTAVREIVPPAIISRMTTLKQVKR